MSNGSTNELRFTETNSADDSAGKTWGLEGNLFWFVAGGAFASVVTLLLLFSMWRWTLLNALVPALIPVVLALLYALAFRQGKPSGYDIDLFELWLKGVGFGPELPRVKARSSSPPDNHV
ncbi:MAG: hypothetical protein M3128_00130 [Verrucomicrobiota bacterium]|nr:hypothetical protein [Verrucomicrobiota bacterium]